jgi:hypothetical protein
MGGSGMEHYVFNSPETGWMADVRHNGEVCLLRDHCGRCVIDPNDIPAVVSVLSRAKRYVEDHGHEPSEFTAKLTLFECSVLHRLAYRSEGGRFTYAEQCVLEKLADSAKEQAK